MSHALPSIPAIWQSQYYVILHTILLSIQPPLPTHLVCTNLSIIVAPQTHALYSPTSVCKALAATSHQNSPSLTLKTYVVFASSSSAVCNHSLWGDSARCHLGCLMRLLI